MLKSFSSQLSPTALTLLVALDLPRLVLSHKPPASRLVSCKNVKVYWPLGCCGFTTQPQLPSPSSQLRSVWPAQFVIKVSSSEAPKNLGRKMSLSTKESVWGGRTQAWWGCSAGLLPKEPCGAHFCFKAPSALLCYCVSCKGSSCFRRKPDSTWQGLHLLAPGLFQLVLHHTKADHRLLSLNCSAVIMVCPSCMEQAAATAGVGQECCSFPLLPTRLVQKLSLNGPPEHSQNMQRWSSLFHLMLKKINSHFNISLLFF